MWTVANAKSQLSEILRRARAGEPQVIGSQNPCVVISRADFDAKFASHDGAWLLRQSVGIAAELELPPRAGDPQESDLA